MALNTHTHKVNGCWWLSSKFYNMKVYKKKGRNIIPKGAYMSLVRNSLLSSLYLLANSLEEEIQLSKDCVDTTRGWTLITC